MEHAPSPSWADLPADALREIAGYLRDVTDFTRFHAVCRSWRDAAPRRLPSLLPWLMARSGFSASSKTHFRFRSPLSSRDTPPEKFPVNNDSGRRLLWPNAANGSVFSSLERTYSFFNPLTGEAVAAFPYPAKPTKSFRSPDGLFCSDTVTLLKHMVRHLLSVVQSRLGQDVVSAGGIPQVTGTMAGLMRRRGRDRHVLEFQGQVLCADVVLSSLVCVHVLQVSDDGRLRWVTANTEHLCFFLGWDSSFAVDVRDFAGTTTMTGSSAYFVGRWVAGKEVYGVFRYGFQDGTATVVDELPVGFNDKSMWFMPRPRLPAACTQSTR